MTLDGQSNTYRVVVTERRGRQGWESEMQITRIDTTRAEGNEGASEDKSDMDDLPDSESVDS